MLDPKEKPDWKLIEYWNDGDGSITWLTAIEAELENRGYSPRNNDGSRNRSLVTSDDPSGLPGPSTPDHRR